MEYGKLGFGCMRLPLTDAKDQTAIDSELLNKMVDAYLDAGFDYFDSAYMYHDFMSEVAMREALVKRHPRDSFKLATKMPTMLLAKEGDQERIFAEQLEKCGVEYFDYYLLHNLNVMFYANVVKFDTFAFVNQMKEEGKIRKLGFSFHDKAELLEELLKAHPEVDFVQLQLNYLDWENDGIQARECYEIARKYNKDIIVMEPLKGGTLAEVPELAEKIMKDFNPDASVASWAFRFVAGLEGVIIVLSGMTQEQQLLENIETFQNVQPLTDKERQILDQVVEIINAANPIACTNCRYCVKNCPKNIAIPEYFSLFNAHKQSVNRDFSIHQYYYFNYLKDHGKASDCLECGLCEQACPQHLPIIEYLEEVAEEFE